ncbi:MAG: dehydrogenase E1 component subunit alpha/beta [Ignavibacteriaceae bacterium]
MKFDRKDYSNETLIELYIALLTPRIIEQKMINLIRQGKITKWFSGIGQEAISVGCAYALAGDEFILTMHRNLGVFSIKDVPLRKLFSQFQGKANGFTNGRDRSFHFGTLEHHIVGMISHLGPQFGVADGIALWSKIHNEKKVTLVFTGEGGTSEGDFHEAVNVAAVWNLPVIFLIENNGYGLSTPTSEQFKCKSLADKGIGYGIEARTIEGNNILEVYSTIKEIAEDMRKNPGPVLIEAITFRMNGHEEASGTKYVPDKLFAQWMKKDPIINYEKFLVKEKVITKGMVKTFIEKIQKDVDDEWEIALSEVNIAADSRKELNDVYAPFTQKVRNPISEKKNKKRFVDAINDALSQSMAKYKDLIIMGQDVAEYGGVFKVTDGFLKKFGKDRVRNTPLCESAIIGAGLGYSICGGKSVVEMQFADFVSSGFTQVINNLAKTHYRWGQNADVVIRMPTGAGVEAGPFHSQSNETWFTHTPGLKVVYPATPYDAKGLLNAAIEDPNPVMYFEHKALYRSIREETPDDYFTIEIGKANLIRKGGGLSIITYGMGVHWAIDALKESPDISADLLDLRSLLPWDKEAVKNSVRKTGKVILLHEDCLTGGIGGEISAWISENCFEFLDAPIMRCGSLDTPVPFAKQLEDNFLPAKRFKEKLTMLWKY